MLLHTFNERNQRRCVCRLWSDGKPHHIFRIDSVLKIIPLLQLTVKHGVFFHSHEGCILICFRIAVTITAFVRFLHIFFQFLLIDFKCFYALLQVRFSFSDFMCKFYILMLFESIEFPAQFFDMLQTEVLLDILFRLLYNPLVNSCVWSYFYFTLIVRNCTVLGLFLSKWGYLTFLSATAPMLCYLYSHPTFKLIAPSVFSY